MLLVLANGSVSQAAPAEKAIVRAPYEADERLVYRWSLGGLMGTVARVFIPGQGDGSLSTRRNDEGHLVTELMITSKRSREGEYWHYGAVIDPVRRRTLKAWMSQVFRGETKEKSADLEDESVIDFTSGIHLLREDPPSERRRMTIWSNGKFYPVDVFPTGRETKQVAGEPVAARCFAIRGAEVEGQRLWTGKLDLCLAEDEAATPVEISILRRGARIQLELVEDASPGAAG